MTNPVRIVVYREGSAWVGQCLEYDIAAQGDTESELLERMDEVLNLEAVYTQSRHGAAFAKIDPAPQMFFSMWDRCADTSPPTYIGKGSSAPQVQMARCA